ncbi:putative transcriptional regulator [Streptomyces sp. V3I8]|uniref:helix-turn-helix domain-containing protein n=1 Tax=Streptomyces sp. V3I8 TaxID=3042279 RepID=UPI00277EDE1B|nr:helix-turn-helix transcriptional regulator [Streptomyces sp. V3I8]MDQ1041560.1 putative transcriptional regulator [Streptomyces sp. V3I8]
MTPASEDHQIHVTLDKVMEKRDITLTDLAEKVGITNANLSRLKTGKVMAVKFSTLTALCAALDCQPGDILSYVPANAEAPVSD